MKRCTRRTFLRAGWVSTGLIFVPRLIRAQVNDLGDPQFLARLIPSAIAGETPATYPTLATWFRSTDLILSDGDPISTWSDQSINANHATGSSTARPTYKTAIIGSTPVVRFDGLNDFLTLTTQLSLGTSMTALILLKSPLDGPWAGFSGGHALWFLNSSNKQYFFDSVTTDLSDTFGGTATDFKMITVRRNGSDVIYRENKTTRGTHNVGGTGFSLDLVGKSAQGAGFFSGADMVELSIWSNPLTDGNLDSLYDNYFKPRYSTLP